MRVKFHQNLDELKEKLLIMAGMAEQAITRSIEAYRTRDFSICELVFQTEPSINRLEREIDQMALDLLAMEQPMAIDLRFILAVIRINADLERVGDQAVNIAVRVREMGAFANIDLPVDIPSRSLSDNLRGEKDVTGKLRDEMFGSLANDERIQAYKEVQFGCKAASVDAEEYEDVVGDYKDNGQY